LREKKGARGIKYAPQVVGMGDRNMEKRYVPYEFLQMPSLEL